MIHFFLCSLLLLQLTPAARAQVFGPEKCAIAFYNLENLFDPEDDPLKYDEEFTPLGANHYTQDIYRQKLHNMASALGKIATDHIPEGPAVYGIAEIENERVLLDLVSEPELRHRNLKIVHFESPDSRGIDVALLYNPRQFKVITAKALPVNITENGQVEYSRDILLTKGILEGDTLYIMVCHWPSRRGGEAASQWKRDKAAAICRQVADSLFNLDKGTRIIIMGDLNDDPVSRSVAQVIGAKGKAEEVAPGGFFNPWVKYYRRGMGTLGFDDNWNLFDQIILSHSFVQADDGKWTFRKAEIFDRPFLKTAFGKYKGYPRRSFSGNAWTNGYSDHFPTCIYLSRRVGDPD